MRRIPLKIMGGAIATAFVALMLIGCRGAAGQNGANGTNGTNGNDGSNGQNGTGPVINAAVLTSAEWGGLTLKGTVLSVTTGGAPSVTFKVTDGHDVPVAGLGWTSKASSALLPSLSNMYFSIAKLVPGTNGSPSKWVSYMATSTPTVAAPTVIPARPSVDNTGTLVDNKDGTYKYTFYRDITQAKAILDAYTYTGNNIKDDLGDLTYAPTLTHRIAVRVGGAARGTGTNTPDGTNSGVPSVSVKFPANMFYDFIPATGQPVSATNEQRVITSVDKCFTCHTKFEFHGESFQDTKFCVVCHTDQRKYGRAEATVTSTGYDQAAGTYKIQGHAIGEFPVYIHRLHMGEELTKTGYNYANVLFNEVTYPQDQRNCVKCHSASAATPQGDNWSTKPNRFACGACHDQVDWATGTGHGDLNEGGPQLSDQNCVNCHDAAAIKTYHIPVSPLNPAFATGGYTNGSYLAAYADNLPAGAVKVTYDLKSVALDATRHPMFTFRFLQNGQRADFNDPASKTAIWDGYVGSPSVYMSFAVPQDGNPTPADKNANFGAYIKKVWNHTATGIGAGTLSGPDGSGYYTLTMTGVTIPASATMVTGGIGYTYNKYSQPLTQTSLAGYPYNTTTMLGGLSVPAPNVWKVFPGQTARRTIVSTQKCNDCHSALGVFTASAYHAGERNNAESCHFCHNPNQTSSGWSANASSFIHAIHGGSKRTVTFNWHAASAEDTFAKVTYPGLLNNCEACHVPGSYDFGNSANANAVPNLMYSTVGKGKYNGSSPTAYTLSPYVVKDNVMDYGIGASYNAATGVLTPAASTTLVNSPIAAACVSCHDGDLAIAHMRGNGGSFYEPRATALAKTEQCFLCHSSGKVADVKVVHMTFK